MDSSLPDGRRQRKRQAVHQRLLDVGEELFRERGMARTTVDDIAEAADVARQTFFNHFPSKEALAVELAARGIHEVALRAHALLEAGTPALEVLGSTADRILDAALEQGEIAAVVARELLHPDPERARRAAQQAPLREILEAILLQAREEGTVRDDLPMDMVATRVTTVLRGVLAQICSCDADQLRRELNVCFDIIFHGIIDRSR